jgi:hypothetical protein
VPSILTPDDVRVAARAAHGVLEGRFDLDWSVQAGDLDWDVATTVAHMAGALSKYSLCLAAQSTRFVALRLVPMPDVSHRELARAVLQTADALASVAQSAPPDARGYHPSGMADAEGFLGMGCTELLAHGADVAAGLGAPYEPSDELCRRVAARMFPWAPADVPGWRALQWATGRLELEGLERFEDDDWPWLATPLAEWDGQMPRIAGDAMPTGFDHATDGAWQPVFD